MSKRQKYSMEELKRKIQELSFVKTEIELYLDTHPDSVVAMDYYREAVEALDTYMAEYQAEFGPLVSREGIMNDRWAWVDRPWPWQNGGENGKEERE